MTANNENLSYDYSQNTIVDSTRGKLLTDVQMSADTVPMASTTQQMALNDTTRHEILSILERPVNLGTFEWKTSNTPLPVQLKPSDYDADTQNYLQQFNFPQDIFNNSPIVVDKLKNYQYLKADIEIEVKINAQPFLQGALMLVYNPYYNQTGDFRRKGTRFLASQTSCPYKIVSIEEGNSLKLICPYANIYDLFDLNNSSNQFGSVFLYVFASLLGPNEEETAKYTVFARFVNPQFFVPTQNDVMSSSRNLHEIKRLENQGYRIAQSDVSPMAATDTGEVEARGPVSKIASGVTTIADVLTGIPVIGKVASTVAWVSRTVGKTAASFGWSKPTGIQPQQKAVLKPNNTLIHTEGNDDATTLALLQDNGIDGSSFIPENKDEMDLKYIFGRPNFFHAQTASETLFTARKLITAWEVSPLSSYQYTNTEDKNTLFLGSFAYASMLGTLWRGTINYDIMVVKTPYHQGRFAVVFLPETNIADVPATLGELLNTNYNVVCNLKDRQDEMGRTTFRVSVPFISNTAWRETYKRTTNEDGIGPDATTLDTKTGCLAIYSLVDLSFPPTVSPSVTFFIAHSGGEDYQIARPVMNLAPGYQKRYAQSDIGTVIIPKDENLLVPSHSSQDVTAQTTGEYFNSLRAYIKRFSQFASLKQNPDYIGLRTRHMTEDSTSGARVMSRLNFTDKVAPTPWYMASFLYRFYNGSSQLKCIPPTPGMLSDAFLQFDEDIISQKIIPASLAIGQPKFMQQQQVSNCFEIRTPFYRGVRCDVVDSNQTPLLGDARTCVRSRNVGGYGSTSAESPLYEAAGDDFSYFFMIGPPPMSDIQNLTLISSFPTGVERTVSFTGINTMSDLVNPDLLQGQPITVTGSPTNVQVISSSSREFVEIVYTDASTEQVPVTSCLIDPTSGSIKWQAPRNSGKTTDLVATQALWTAYPDFTVVTQDQ